MGQNFKGGFPCDLLNLTGVWSSLMAPLLPCSSSGKGGGWTSSGSQTFQRRSCASCSGKGTQAWSALQTILLPHNPAAS